MTEDHDEERKVIASPTVRIRQKGQITLPKEVQEALYVKEGDQIQFNIHEDGRVAMEGLAEIPADQRWFWTPEWQEGEREASAQIAAGGGKVFHDIDEMFDYLNRER
ncbi:AbrB/MazE/SpoVT family DNA-binding domain-containing protein [Glycomyces tenuis]|uniref:AbrB/MazE/SpoVT family DNA-binding domain-containing protein n=1 Tax=Glycomyces tenuis TaxID=58116 RepID=UPI001B7FC769|nr:AbrB/MazE/SpoVT family DNA-binding domain-containing protein [Glycomyces tenuis]